MGGYQGLMNASDVHAADLRQGTMLEYLDHETSGPPHPASYIFPLDGSERRGHGRWRKIQAFTTHAAFSPVRAIRPVDMGYNADCPMSRNIKTSAA